LYKKLQIIAEPNNFYVKLNYHLIASVSEVKMAKYKTKLNIIMFSLAAMLVGGITFHNCARAKFFDPDATHSAFALGYCQNCGDETGLGIQCRPNLTASFGPCVFESCSVGYKLENMKCIQVVCENEQVASCPIEHGEGRMVCSNNAYGSCNAISCENGYELQGNVCVASEPPPPGEDPPVNHACDAGEIRDCSSNNRYGNQACAEDRNGWSACVFGDCKPGNHLEEDGGKCVSNTCTPNERLECTEGVGSGFKTCNSIGSAWGSCIIEDCQAGYRPVEGVCVAQTCEPNKAYACSINGGIGERICNAEGTDYGACTFLACEKNYTLIEGVCQKHTCTPTSQEDCSEGAGSGVHYCYENGMGYGVCQINKCADPFVQRGNSCVAQEYCEAGEKFACYDSAKKGSGLRACKDNNNKIGTCELNAQSVCDSGYTLTYNANSSNYSCKKN
jgi:hypothetical protein